MQNRTLTLGHSPDPDDAFMFYALAKDLIPTAGFRFQHILQDIQTLNERATRGELDISAISIHAYAYVSGPASVQEFTGLPRTFNTSVQDLLLDDRVAVLADVWDTRAVQTVAAFASLHVAITITTCLVAELLRLPRWVRLTGWAFAALTCLSTVYLGWHFFVDVLGGFAVGTLSLVLAAWATGHPLRRRDRTWSLGEARAREEERVRS